MKPLQALLALFAFAFLPLHAASLDDLTWTTTGGEVTITDCDRAATGELVIPDTIEGNPVTSIGGYAFEGCPSLTSITIPDGVTSIGVQAFRGCTSLTSITIPDRVTNIEYGAFYGCISLTSVTIGNSVTSIGYGAFRNCTGLTSITFLGTAPTVGTNAFTGVADGAVAEVRLLSAGSFGGIGASWEGLTVRRFILGLLTWWTTTGGEVIITNCDEDATGELVIPDTIEGNPVTSIAAWAFQECTSLTSITIPDGVTSIGGGAFQNCSSLLSVKIPSSIEKIIGSAFKDCSSLTTVQFPNKDFTIGPEAFYQAGLTSLIIPNDQIYIGHTAFRLCPITEIEVPDTYTASLAYIGIRPDIAHQKLMESIASNEVATAAVAANTAEINKIKDQLAILVDALAQKDEEIANKNERITRLEDLSLVSRFSLLLEEKDEQIAALELRPTQTEFDAVVTERDARPTLEEIQDARTGSVILTPSEDGTVQLKIEIEESADLEVWENQGKSIEAGFPLAEGKKFLRFALN
jgi:hypothetical protein